MHVKDHVLQKGFAALCLTMKWSVVRAVVRLSTRLSHAKVQLCVKLNGRVSLTLSLRDRPLRGRMPRPSV